MIAPFISFTWLGEWRVASRWSELLFVDVVALGDRTVSRSRDTFSSSTGFHQSRIHRNSTRDSIETRVRIVVVHEVKVSSQQSVKSRKCDNAKQWKATVTTSARLKAILFLFAHRKTPKWLAHFQSIKLKKTSFYGSHLHSHFPAENRSHRRAHIATVDWRKS